MATKLPWYILPIYPALALALDTKKIEQAGLIQPGWEKEATNDSIVHKSVVAFVPRDANIKENCHN